MSVSTRDIPSFNVVCRPLESGNYTPVNQIILRQFFLTFFLNHQTKIMTWQCRLVQLAYGWLVWAAEIFASQIDMFLIAAVSSEHFTPVGWVIYTLSFWTLQICRVWVRTSGLPVTEGGNPGFSEQSRVGTSQAMKWNEIRIPISSISWNVLITYLGG